MIIKTRTFYHFYMTTKKPGFADKIDNYLRIGNYRFIIRGESDRHNFYDI